VNVNPGDGRWVLHLPGGRVNPWQSGIWRAIARAYIRKDHAALKKDNWEGKLANPARAAISSPGASEAQQRGWFNAVGSWGINTVFDMPLGYDVKLIESNGNGHESFATTIQDQNNEIVIAVAGQTVTTDGGAGFSNASVHESVRDDLIKGDGEGIETTLNTQVLPWFIIEEFGEEALHPGAVVQYDVTPPKDRNSEASSLEKLAQALKQLDEAYSVHGVKIDATALAIQYGVPVLADESPVPTGASFGQLLTLIDKHGLQLTRSALEDLARRFSIEVEEAPEGTPNVELTPTALEKITLVREGRESNNLSEMGDERDDKTIAELAAEAEADAEADGEVEVAEAQTEMIDNEDNDEN
jgi:hypothetical protein